MVFNYKYLTVNTKYERFKSNIFAYHKIFLKCVQRIKKNPYYLTLKIIIYYTIYFNNRCCFHLPMLFNTTCVKCDGTK